MPASPIADNQRRKFSSGNCSMKSLAYGAAFVAMLMLAAPGQAQAPVSPGTPPAVSTQAPPPTPYVVPMPTPKTSVKKPVRRKSRARLRSGSDNIANRLNAQELAHGGMAGGMAGAAYGGPGYPGPAGSPPYPPPMYRPPPPPGWYPPPPRPWYGRPWGY